MAYTQVLVNAPSVGSNPDGTEVFQLGGKLADGLVSDLHGKWYTAAYRGLVYHAVGGHTLATAIAGQVVPVLGATTQTALTLYNPMGSGKNLEVISLRLGPSITTDTEVIGSVGFGVLTNIGAGTALITTYTTAMTFSTPIGNNTGTTFVGGNNVGKAFDTCTVAAATNFLDIGLGFGGTGVNNWGVIEKTFDGNLVLAPGTAIVTQGTVAQTSSYVIGMSWAEWPI